VIFYSFIKYKIRSFRNQCNISLQRLLLQLCILLIDRAIAVVMLVKFLPDNSPPSLVDEDIVKRYLVDIFVV
jgi:hypothetical protein